MSNFANIKAGIIAKLKADTDLDSNSVYDYEPNIRDIEQDPFAVVIASENENDFSNTVENKRRYGFLVRLAVERNSRGESNAEDVLTGMVDRIVDSFDQDSTLSVSGVLFVEASPSVWGYILSDKEYRTADIKVIANVWFDTS